MPSLSDLIRLLRPKQWIKNVFVFTGVIFSGMLLNPEMLINAIVSAISFCFASSCIYIFNDIIDIESDKQHPTKQFRPLACGKIQLKQALVICLICGVFSLLISLLYVPMCALFIISYILLNIAYSLRLKEIVIIDVFCIALGFMLRIFAGTLGIGIMPSNWLLLCGLMITLFLGFAKRRAEMIQLKNNQGQQRKVLTHYSSELLDELTAICATSVIIGYSLYTVSKETIELHHTENLMLTVPFVAYAMFRYLFLLHRGKGCGDPTNDLTHDKHIMISVLLWASVTIYLVN